MTWLDPIAAEADPSGSERYRSMSRSDAVDPATRVLRSEREAQVRAAVATLDEPYREVVALRFFADRSLAEIADATERPAGHREDPPPPRPRAAAPRARGGRGMTADRPADGTRRPFGADELPADGVQPGRAVRPTCGSGASSRA